MKLETLPLPTPLLDLLKKQGYIDLYPPQQLAYEAGVFQGENLLVTTPTASGKTLVAMMATGRLIAEGLGKTVYLTPLRALASEKYDEFKVLQQLRKPDGSNVKVVISTGDYDSSGESLGGGDVIILTNERFDSILRHNVSWLEQVKLFVADEVHLVGDGHRGPTLETILTNI
ncbi:MAG: DEAD/DEAH box helicase, partial [Thaumarchaeota archaeon]|nr:DEAD/DEAH box helicase [Nitrososphaerota archaeon]